MIRSAVNGTITVVMPLHTDHLGTASYVTNENGETTQFFLNLPFGETMAEQNLDYAYQNPDVYKDQPEIYKRMKLSYFFEGRSKTLKTFSPIKDKIPYKFKYDIIKDSLKSPLEFLKDGMDYR